MQSKMFPRAAGRGDSKCKRWNTPHSKRFARFGTRFLTREAFGVRAYSAAFVAARRSRHPAFCDCIHIALHRKFRVMSRTTLATILLVTTCLLSVSKAAETNAITHDTVLGAEQLIGLDLSSKKIDMLLPGLRNQLRDFETIRKIPLSNAIPPA